MAGLANALEGLRVAVEGVREQGLPLVVALRHVGIEVPSFAGPILERAFGA